jgi:hypothetical protein
MFRPRKAGAFKLRTILATSLRLYPSLETLGVGYLSGTGNDALITNSANFKIADREE